MLMMAVGYKVVNRSGFFDSDSGCTQAWFDEEKLGLIRARYDDCK